MYATRDKNGNAFKWSKKGKNRECWIKDKKCITKECFIPENCGTINEKTQEKNILGMCLTYFNGICPIGYHNDDKCPITIDKDKIQNGKIFIEKDRNERDKKGIDKTNINSNTNAKTDNINPNTNNINVYQTKSYYKKMKKRRNYG